MAVKKEVKMKKKKERTDVLKIIGIALCFAAVILLVWTVYITTDLREQKAVINNYLSAVQSNDYEKLMNTYYPEYREKYAEYESTEGFKEKYMTYKLGHISNGYGENLKIKSKITSRFDYKEMLKLTDNLNIEAVLVDATLTYYNDTTSAKDEATFILVEEGGKWYIFDSDIEVIPDNEYELIEHCTK